MKILSLTNQANAWIEAVKAGDRLISHSFDASKPLDWPAVKSFAVENEAGVIVVEKLPPADIIAENNLEELLFEFRLTRVKQTLGIALNLGRRIDLMKPIMNYVGKAEYKLELMRRARKDDHPAGILPVGETATVACLTSIDPLMAAGGWVNDMLDDLEVNPAFMQVPPAGVHKLIEYHDQPITWSALEEIDPDFIILMPRLFSENELTQFSEQFLKKSDDKAFKSRDSFQVYLITEPELIFSASPILYEGINLLSHIIYRSSLTKRTAHKPFVRLEFPF